MSKATQKSPDLTAAFAERSPVYFKGVQFVNNPYYLKFFKSLGNAFDVVFRYIAHADQLEDQCLRQVLKAGETHIHLVFSTHKELKIGPNKTIIPDVVHEPSQAIFGPMFEVIDVFAQKDADLETEIILPGLYELRISDPRAGLHLLHKFLKHHGLSCADLPYGETLAINGPPSETVDTEIQEEALSYMPPQFYSSGYEAQKAAQFVIDKFGGYPFSLQYMLALIEQAETPPGKAPVFTETLEAFRLQ